VAKTLQLKKRQQALFDAHRAWAEAIGRRLCGAHLPPCFEVDDLVQAALVGLTKACREFDETRGVPFCGFAHTYVQCECLMSVRRRGYESAKYEELSLAAQAPAGDRPDVQAEAMVEARRVRDALAKLQPRERQAIRAVFWNSMQLAALGRSLHMRQIEADALLASSLEKLREMLA